MNHLDTLSSRDDRVQLASLTDHHMQLLLKLRLHNIYIYMYIIYPCCTFLLDALKGTRMGLQSNYRRNALLLATAVSRLYEGQSRTLSRICSKQTNQTNAQEDNSYSYSRVRSRSPPHFSEVTYKCPSYNFLSSKDRAKGVQKFGCIDSKPFCLAPDQALRQPYG